METIKNYLDTMFANLPNTNEVHKAKSELYQMMEDKYTELIAEGKSENEAVGTVISEFGNLEELAEELNITEEQGKSILNDVFAIAYANKAANKEEALNIYIKRIEQKLENNNTLQISGDKYDKISAIVCGCSS